jgi:hypothetical protein
MGTQWIEGWVDPRASLNNVEKTVNSAPARNPTLAIQPAANTTLTELPQLISYWQYTPYNELWQLYDFSQNVVRVKTDYTL